MLKKVRMLDDYPPGAEGADVLFRKGDVREVDPLRCGRLVEDELAEVLPDNWEPYAAASLAPVAPEAPATENDAAQAEPFGAFRRKKGGA